MPNSDHNHAIQVYNNNSILKKYTKDATFLSHIQKTNFLSTNSKGKDTRGLLIKVIKWVCRLEQTPEW